VGGGDFVVTVGEKVVVARHRGEKKEVAEGGVVGKWRGNEKGGEGRKKRGSE
jgi:hypothetical protein